MPSKQLDLCTCGTAACPAAASPAPALQVLASWVLYRVLAEHRQWRYAQRSERWRLAGAGLRLVRLALLSAPGPAGEAAGEEGCAAIAAAVAAVLRYDVNMTACLLSALPLHAEQLEASGGGCGGDGVCRMGRGREGEQGGGTGTLSSGHCGAHVHRRGHVLAQKVGLAPICLLLPATATATAASRSLLGRVHHQ